MKRKWSALACPDRDKRGKTASSLADCPVCGRKVPAATVSIHLDTDCRGPPAAAPDAPASCSLDGAWHSVRGNDDTNRGTGSRCDALAYAQHVNAAGVLSASSVPLPCFSGIRDVARTPSISASDTDRASERSTREPLSHEDAGLSSGPPRLQAHSPLQPAPLPSPLDPPGDSQASSLPRERDSSDATQRPSAHTSPGAALDPPAMPDPAPKVQRGPAHKPHPLMAAARARAAQTNGAGHRPRSGAGSAMESAHDAPAALAAHNGACSPAACSVPGEQLYLDFINAEEEAQLLELVDAGEPPWHDSRFNGYHRGKRWGVQMDLARGVVQPADVEMPPLLVELAARMRRQVGALSAFRPNEANAIEYLRSSGHHLLPHVDNRKLSTNVIVTLSLVGCAVMTFVPDGQSRRGARPYSAKQRPAGQTRAAPPFAASGSADKGSGVEEMAASAPSQQAQPHTAGASGTRGGLGMRTELPARSLHVLTGPARYSFTHEIRREDFRSRRRVSITFRESPL